MFSRCLGFEACRYDGAIIRDATVASILLHVEPITVCPETEIGLGVPRKPVRLVEEQGRILVLQPETGRDVTDEMTSFAERFLDEIPDVDGFLLKCRSPSCGVGHVRVYNGRSPDAGYHDGAGAFARRVTERLSALAIEDEGRLRSFDVRQHFLTKLFALARFRGAAASRRMRDLVSFHARHKFLLMVYHQTAARAMGQIVANPERLAVERVLTRYRECLHAALAKAPRRMSAVNALLHAFGYVSDGLSANEKALFLEALRRYGARQVPLAVPTSLIRSWIVRFGVDYLLDQVYFEPFPPELVSVLDSGEGRDAS